MENILYLAVNIFRVYAIYLLIGAFIEKKDINRYIYFGVYFLFYIINSCGYLLLESSIVNITTNVVPVFLITFLYKTKLFKRIFVTILVCAMAMFWEAVLYALFSYLKISDYESICLFSESMLLFFTARLAQLLLKSRFEKNTYIKGIYYVALAFVPLSSIVIGYLTLTNWGLEALIIAVLLLSINFLVFYMFDEIELTYISRQEAESIRQNRNYIEHELSLMEQAQLKTDCLRHDMKNHFQQIESYANENNIEDLKKYINQGIDAVLNNSDIVFTGNKNIDCLLNFKRDNAKKQGIEMIVSASVPNDLTISTFDLNTILSNLLDNAIEASLNCEKKIIDIQLQYSKNVLLIIVSNYYDGNTSPELKTRKSDKALHGFGLKSIQFTAEKYKGTVKFDFDDEKFTSRVLLYDK